MIDIITEGYWSEGIGIPTDGYWSEEEGEYDKPEWKIKKPPRWEQLRWVFSRFRVKNR